MYFVLIKKKCLKQNVNRSCALFSMENVRLDNAVLEKLPFVMSQKVLPPYRRLTKHSQPDVSISFIH